MRDISPCRIAVMIGIVALGGFLLCPQLSAETLVTPEEGIEIARACFARLGWPVPLEEPTGCSLEPEPDYVGRVCLDVWWMELGLSALIDARTGMVTAVHNHSLPDRLAEAGPAALSSEVALELARKYLEAVIGFFPQDFMLAENAPILETPGGDDLVWDVRWDRILEGPGYVAEYMSDAVLVTLHPDTGELYGLGWLHHLPEPALVLRPISLAEAAILGWNRLVTLGYEPGQLLEARMRVVFPSNRWDLNVSSVRDLSVDRSKTVIVWELVFGPEPEHPKLMVGVAAGTGVIMGGGTTLSPIPKLGEAVPDTSGDLAAEAGANVSKEEALEAARRCSDALGWEKEPNRTLFTPPDLADINHWSFIYDIPEGESRAIFVHAENGEVSELVDLSVPERTTEQGEPQLSREEAIGLATGYAEIAGLPEGTELKEAKLESAREGTESLAWWVIWERAEATEGEVHSVTVKVHPDDGRLISLRKEFKPAEVELSS